MAREPTAVGFSHRLRQRTTLTAAVSALAIRALDHQFTFNRGIDEPRGEVTTDLRLSRVRVFYLRSACDRNQFVNPTELSAIIFLCIFGSALLGMELRSVIPEHHLNGDTKDLVKLGVGLIGTMAALLLGLLVASAKSSYDARSSELTQMAANTILLDRALAHYGPATGEVRGLLRITVARMIDQVWAKDGSRSSFPTQGPGDALFDKLQELAPRSDAQRAIQSQAETLMINLGQTRLLLFAQSGSSISRPFLVVVVFWLSMLSVSFGLFAPRNATAIITLLVTAISVAGALFLILELNQPFSGMLQISSVPLRSALLVLGK